MQNRRSSRRCTRCSTTGRRRSTSRRWPASPSAPASNSRSIDVTNERSIGMNTTRRQLLKTGAATAAALTVLPRAARAQESASPRKYLFVVGAGGGASIIDSFLPTSSSEGASGAAYSALQLSQPAGSMLRCPKPVGASIQGVIALGDGYDMATFLAKHAADTAVMTQECTSVNHQVAARRA